MGAFCTCSRTSRFPTSDGFVEALGAGKRPRVAIAVNARSWKSSVAIMRGRYSLGISNANRQAAEVATRDEAEVDVELRPPQTQVVIEPDDLSLALDDPVARYVFDSLAKNHKWEHVRSKVESSPGHRSTLVTLSAQSFKSPWVPRRGASWPPPGTGRRLRDAGHRRPSTRARRDRCASTGAAWSFHLPIRLRRRLGARSGSDRHRRRAARSRRRGGCLPPGGRRRALRLRRFPQGARRPGHPEHDHLRGWAGTGTTASTSPLPTCSYGRPWAQFLHPFDSWWAWPPTG
jgi:Domain of unknown function (DUF1905)